MKHYVCDKCGNYWQAYRASDCPACKAERIWEFDDGRNAEQHAAHIVRGNQSGLFRTAS